MNDQIPLDGLLFSNDGGVITVMSQVLRTFSIKTETCHELEFAVDAVAHRRLDAIIVDWHNTENPTRIVRSARKSSPNSSSTIVALVNPGDETHALLVGANFMIHKPADAEHASRCMRAAYGTMLQNRRRSARVTIDIPVSARVADIGMIEAHISDLSIGGLALRCGQPLQLDREVIVQFNLPDGGRRMHVTGKVVNANATGRAGIRFSFVPEDDLEALESWLATELAKLESVEIPA
jgi:CheY-like chemotaxis protein